MADADLRPRIVVGLRRVEPAIDFELPGSATLEYVPDLEVLQMALAHQRVLVSHDRSTMRARVLRTHPRTRKPRSNLDRPALPYGAGDRRLAHLLARSEPRRVGEPNTICADVILRFGVLLCELKCEVYSAGLWSV
jgi:hypothetical protein